VRQTEVCLHYPGSLLKPAQKKEGPAFARMRANFNRCCYDLRTPPGGSQPCLRRLLIIAATGEENSMTDSKQERLNRREFIPRRGRRSGAASCTDPHIFPLQPSRKTRRSEGYWQDTKSTRQKGKRLHAMDSSLPSRGRRKSNYPQGAE